MNAAISTLWMFDRIHIQDPICWKTLVLTHPHSTKTDFFVWFQHVGKPVWNTESSHLTTPCDATLAPPTHASRSCFLILPTEVGNCFSKTNVRRELHNTNMSMKSGGKDLALVAKEKKNQLVHLINQPFQLKVMMGAKNRQEFWTKCVAVVLDSCSDSYYAERRPTNMDIEEVFALCYHIRKDDIRMDPY